MKTHLKIVHLVRSPVGGIFRHIIDLAVAQSKEGHDVGVICDSLTGGSFEAAKIADLEPLLTLGVTRLPMPRSIGPRDLGALFRVSSLLRSLRPDILHCHGSKGGVYGRMSKALLLLPRATKVFYAPHGGSLHYAADSREGKVYFAVEKWLERWTHALLHVSDYERRQYEEKIGVPRIPAEVVRNGIRKDETEPVTTATSAVDFLFIGMLRDLKGVDLFINAMRIVNDQRETTAFIVGDGADEDEARYHAMVKSRDLQDVVTFHPAMPARDAFAKTRAIVVPSRAESMPYLVLEAIGASKPLIATNVGGIPEIFKDMSGHLVEPSPETLAQAILRLADANFKTETTAYLHNRVLTNFSIELMEQTIAGIYQTEN